MPYTLPHYAVIRDGEVIQRSESFALARQTFIEEMKENEFLELTLQNTRAIREMALAMIEQSKTKVKELVNA